MCVCVYIYIYIYILYVKKTKDKTSQFSSPNFQLAPSSRNMYIYNIFIIICMEPAF